MLTTDNERKKITYVLMINWVIFMNEAAAHEHIKHINNWVVRLWSNTRKGNCLIKFFRIVSFFDWEKGVWKDWH